MGDRCSYFELLTAAGLRWFADVAVDVAVVEVGLLGRYDATNVCDGTVAVVTNVGQDHTDFAGDWRARIAEEKAGIVKPGSTLVLGETDERVDPDLLSRRVRPRCGSATATSRAKRTSSPSAVACSNCARRGTRCPRSSCRSTARTRATTRRSRSRPRKRSSRSRSTRRWSRKRSVRSRCRDASRSSGASRWSSSTARTIPKAPRLRPQTLRDDFMQEGRRIIVVGMLQPRDPHAMLDALEVDDSTLVIACSPTRRARSRPARSPPPRQSFGADVIEEPDVGRAVDRARRLAGPDDAVLVTGSFYVRSPACAPGTQPFAARLALPRSTAQSRPP